MLPKGPYNPKETEAEILKFWLDNKFYKPEYVSDKKLSTANKDSAETRETYTNILPPPNANGNLHLGHMSGYAYQDLMGRFQRMTGKKVLLFPGKDHAGIQTEVVFENELAKKGKSKKDLGREVFYNACYKFCMDNAATARKQEMNLGLSADFDRELFTLDPKIVDQVLTTFVDMYHDGLIYRDKRLINWCVRCQSALANIDTEYKDATSTFVYFKYAFASSTSHGGSSDVTRTDSIEPDSLQAEPDRYALELKERFENKEIEVVIERVKGQKMKKDPKASLPDNEYEWPFNYYGHIEGEINPADNEELDVILIGFEEGLKVNDKVKGKAIGMMMRLDGDFKLYIVKDGTTEQEVNARLKEHFLSFSKYFGGVQNRIFAIHTEPKHYTQGFIIGTVRHETVFGDTGIAVNPDDKRYAEYVGKELDLIGIQGKVKLKIVADRKVDPAFGTGMLKVTPAHSLDDWDIAMKHKELLPEKQCIGFDGKLNHLCGKYEGMNIDDARKEIEKDMEAEGLLVAKEENYEHKIQICERCKSTIEPLISYQWFLDTNDIKAKAKQLVEDGVTNIMPEGKKNVYLDWMNNPEDWCITRQLWWGYRVPVWYKQQPQEYVTESGEVKEKIGGEIMSSREDYKNLMKVSINPPGQEITFVRHGLSEGNIKEVISGRTDHKLSIEGKKQAAEIEWNGEQFDLIITSPLSRTKETANIIAEKLNIKEIIENDLIIERNFGAIENLTEEEYKKKYPEVGWQWDKELPEGESIDDMEKRIQKLLDLLKTEYSNRKVLVVTHAGVLRGLLRMLKGYSYEESVAVEIRNCEVMRFNIPDADWTQDEDVFDTWFSSGQWPAVTLAVSPNNNPGQDFKDFYPTQVMETGWDILIFWVTRMMLLCPYKSGKLYPVIASGAKQSSPLSSSDLLVPRGVIRGSKVLNLDSRIRGNDKTMDDTQITPFKNVYLHGLVLDKNGVKMSKSKGNGIDPFEMMQKYGTDALRMSFIFGNKPGQNYRLYEEKIETFRNYCNKLWNMSKFVLMNLDNAEFEYSKIDDYKNNLTEEDKVMVNKIDILHKKITRNMDNFQFGVAIQDIYESSWHEFADEFIEQIKTRIYTKDKAGNAINTSESEVKSRMAAMYTLWYSLTNYLKMLHPFIPFITEKIWFEIPKDPEDSQTLMYSKW